MRQNPRSIGLFCLALLLTLASDVDDARSEPRPGATPNPVQVPAAQAEQIGKGEEFQRQAAQRAKPRERSAGIRADAQNPDSRSTSGSANASLAETKAIDRIAAEIRDSLQLRKTLVVWLVEQSADAAPLTRNMADHIDRLFHDLRPAQPDQLKMAVIGYGAELKVLTPEPTSDVETLQTALADLDGQSGDRSDKVVPFAAVNKAIEKFIPYRKLGFEVILVIAGASSGADLSQADEAIAALKRSAVPVFGLGPAVPFGDSVSNRSPRAAVSPESVLPSKQNLETLYPERIPLQLADREAGANLTDCGYGPFGLERLCRQTGGKFFRLRSGGSGGWELNPATGEVKPELLAKYAPDYVNEDQYKQLLDQNKCRLALRNAALLPPTAGLDPNVRTSFPKEKDEATLAKGITVAQRAAAERDQPLQQLYDTLAAGETDRPNLTGARWQAEYDLAMGQMLAAKARLDGYNTMLAALKQGKSFINTTSKRWVLEPADEIAAASALDKMVKNSRAYLERVVAEHKGTPWAAIAQGELRHPAGWKLVEDSEAGPNPSRPKKNANR